MKRKIVFSLAIFVFCTLSLKAQNDETGLPGDHFNLHAVLDLFEKVKSVEEFEKALNKKNNEINNLDLDEDGNVDYIVVRELTEGSAHLFVLTVPVGNEFQDIATVEIEKTVKKKP
jgi:isocitrate/isopropylmalate dehydrogenase